MDHIHFCLIRTIPSFLFYPQFIEKPIFSEVKFGTLSKFNFTKSNSTSVLLTVSYADNNWVLTVSYADNYYTKARLWEGTHAITTRNQKCDFSVAT